MARCSGTELLFRWDGQDARPYRNASRRRRAAGTPLVPRDSRLSDLICGMGTHASFVFLALVRALHCFRWAS